MYFKYFIQLFSTSLLKSLGKCLAFKGSQGFLRRTFIKKHQTETVIKPYALKVKTWICSCSGGSACSLLVFAKKKSIVLKDDHRCPHFPVGVSSCELKTILILDSS